MTFTMKFVLFTVYKVFENVAEKYDVMNDAMSFGIHRLWKDSLLHTMNPLPGTKLLDVAGGTGTVITQNFAQCLYSIIVI